MVKKYYFKKNKISKKVVLRILGSLLIGIGFVTSTYIFFPLVLWQIFIAPKITNDILLAPIPRDALVTNLSIQQILNDRKQAFASDLTQANNWFPKYQAAQNAYSNVSYYSLSVPKININNAIVSAIDGDLKRHLVNLTGTCVPPQKGNCVIFGHSTLPQLFRQGDYTTIFANVLQLERGDEFIVKVNDEIYRYRIFSITVVSPDDTSALAQTTDDSYISVITCTPPGTTIARLVLKARLETI
jgi:sortase A